MQETTARELAWLRSIEPPAIPSRERRATAGRSVAACLTSAKAALQRSREILASTLPPDARAP